MTVTRILIALIFTSLPCLAAPTEQSSVYNDGCQITGHFRDVNQTSFHIHVEDALFSAPTAKDVKVWWGVTQGTPNRMTTLVDFRIGSVPVKIPYRAYADLGNPLIPNGISLTKIQDETILSLRGGEGSAAYVARFVVSNGKLIRREVLQDGNPEAKPSIVTFD